MLFQLLAIFIGIILAFGSIILTKKYLSPTNEKRYYSLTLIPIAMIYIGFSYYYGATDTLRVELIGVMIFSVFALLGQFVSLLFLIIGYLLHGSWDILHELFKDGIWHFSPWTGVPIGYALFCLVYDFIIAVYIYKRWKIWQE